MVQVRYAFVTAKTAPYMRMLKFLDGIPEVVSTFPDAVSPIPLAMAGWSPDGKYLLAADDTEGTTQLRMWRMDAVDEFTPLAVAALPNASTLTAIQWMDDTHVAVAGRTGGAHMGILNRTTGVITWSQFSTDLNFTGLAWFEPAKILYATRDTTSTYYRYWSLDGDTLIVNATDWTHASQIIQAARPLISSRGVMQLHRVANSTPDSYYYFNEETKRIDTSNSAVVTNFVAASHYYNDPAIIQTAGDCHPKGGMFINSWNAAPYIGMHRIIGRVNLPFTLVKNADPMPDLPAAANAIKFIGNEYVLFGLSVNTLNTGRVRGYYLDETTIEFTEDTSVRALFADWPHVPTSIEASPALTVGASAGIYHSTIKAVLDTGANLDAMKLMLLTAAAPYDPTHTALTQVNGGGAYEVTGSSWPAGGVVVLNTNIGAGDDFIATLLGSLPSVALNDPGSVTFRKIVVYDDSHANKRPLFFVDFGTDQFAEQFDQMQFATPGNQLMIFDRAT